MPETVRCALCNQNDYSILYDNMPDWLTGVPGRFRLAQCRHCQLVYQNPRLNSVEIERHYPPDYESYYKGTRETLSPLQWRLLNYGLRKRAAPLFKHCKKGRLLDIGCATGHFPHYVREHSQWEAEGVEPNAEAASFAKEQFGLQVHVGYLSNLDLPSHSFDAVTMWDVLEHVPDPHDLLQQIKLILKPDGILLIRVPVLDSLDARLFRAYWPD